jgi:hypothetical protein
MNNKRHRDQRESRWDISKPTIEDPTLVVCPKCNDKAVITPTSNERLKASCTNCGFSANQPEDNHGFYWHDENPTDGYFGYPLWLQTQCVGQSLWVFNLRHLELLESYVGVKLRQRSKDKKWGWQNSSLTSRLPKWMKEAKNREEVLKSLNFLRKKQ